MCVCKRESKRNSGRASKRVNESVSAPDLVRMYVCVVCVVMTNREATVFVQHLETFKPTRYKVYFTHTHVFANFYKYLDHFDLLEMLLKPQLESVITQDIYFLHQLIKGHCIYFKCMYFICLKLHIINHLTPCQSCKNMFVWVYDRVFDSCISGCILTTCLGMSVCVCVCVSSS